MTTTSFSGRSSSASSASSFRACRGSACAQAEQVGVRPQGRRDGGVERRVGAEVDREPAVGLEQDGERQQAELVPFAGRAREHRGSANR